MGLLDGRENPSSCARPVQVRGDDRQLTSSLVYEGSVHLRQLWEERVREGRGREREKRGEEMGGVGGMGQQRRGEERRK